MSKIRILLAEDDQVMRTALAILLARDIDLEVAGQVAQTCEIGEALDTLHPDVLLLVLGTHLTKQSAIQVLQTIPSHCPKARVVLLSNSELKACLVELLEAGVAGYMLKSDPAEMVARAVRAVAQGERWLSPRVTEILVKAAGRGNDGPPGGLTDRELEVLRLMAAGHRNNQIAKLLHVTEQTVKNHNGSIYSKLSVKTRVQAVLYAVQQGLVPVEK